MFLQLVLPARLCFWFDSCISVSIEGQIYDTAWLSVRERERVWQSKVHQFGQNENESPGLLPRTATHKTADCPAAIASLSLTGRVPVSARPSQSRSPEVNN